MKLKIDSYEFMNYEIMNHNSWDQEAKLHSSPPPFDKCSFMFIENYDL